MLACSIPVSLPNRVPTQEIVASITPTLPPTNTPTLVPTPVPTPIPFLRIEEGDLWFFYGDWERASLVYGSALENTDDPAVQAAARMGIARIEYQTSDYTSARDKFLEIIAANVHPYSVDARYHLALTYEALGSYAEAAQSYQDYLDQSDVAVASYIYEQKADALIASGAFQEAINTYQSAISHPRLSDAESVSIKIGQAYASLGDYETAIITYNDVYSSTINDFRKAQIDYLKGQAFTALDDIEEANQAYLDAVTRYPLSYDSYLGLIELVENGYPVNELDRGIVDYYAGQYSVAVAAFDRYLMDEPEDSATALYYQGLSFISLGEADPAIEVLQKLIQNYPDSEYLDEAWNEIVYGLWVINGQYEEAADFAIQFTEMHAEHPSAPEFLYYAGRIRERNDDLLEAAQIWERTADQYPQSEEASDSIFQAAIAHYRLGNYTEALALFQRYASSSVDFSERSAAEFWIGKIYQVQGETASAEGAWERAANLDPTGYYSERAQDYLEGRSAFQPPDVYDIGVDLVAEREEAAEWLKTTFGYPADLEVITPGPLYNDPRFQRGTEFWQLGEYELAHSEFEALRVENTDDALISFRLANYYHDIGLYRSAIFAARSVLDLAGMDDASTLTAPDYFNHIRFGTYYREIVQPVAEAYGFHPLFLWSVIRMESLFEGFVRSSAGARGLMQIIPSTGSSIHAQAGWPANYTAEDLYRPKVSITYGADYLADQRTAFEGDLYAALAAYNGGPGNAFKWDSIANGDTDLFVEVVRFDETRRYLRGITEIFSIYREIYDRTP